MERIQPISEDIITPKGLYLNRREFLRAIGITSAALLLAACEPGKTGTTTTLFGGDELTAKEDALDYVNFYEFSLSKRGVSERTENFVIDPWQIQIDGLIANPQTVGVEELLQRYKIDEIERVFLMGPLYHLLDETERVSAVKAALAMLKPNGILYASFLMMFSGIIYFLRDAQEMVVQPGEQVWLDAVRKQISWGGDAFTRAFFIDQDEILPFMRQFDVEILHLFGQEGITATHNYALQDQPEDIQNAWIELSVDLCEIPKYLSHSEHAMVIAKKC